MNTLALHLTSLVIALGIASSPMSQAVSAELGSRADDPAPVTTTQASKFSVPDGSGGVFIGWLRNVKSTTHIALQRLDASGQRMWDERGRLVYDSYYGQSDMLLLSDKAGGLYVIWSDNRTGGRCLVAQHVTGSGLNLWPPEGRALTSPQSGWMELVSVADDSTGGFYVVWNDAHTGNYDVYAQHVDGEGTPLWPAAGVTVCSAANDQHARGAINDGWGGLIVGWEDARGASTDIYAQSIDATGAVQWEVNGVAACSVVGNQTNCLVESDGLGGAFLAWLDPRASVSDVYVQRITSIGATAFSSGGVRACTLAGNRYGLVMTAVTNGIVLAWTESRGGGYTSDVYAQWMDITGANHWSSSAKAVCTATNSQYELAILPDASGGAILAWADSREEAGGVNFSDIYMQHLDAFGTAYWGTNGKAITSVVGVQRTPQLQSDGLGGVVVDWLDQRTTDDERYAQRVSIDGVTQWGANGVPVLLDRGVQRHPSMASDGFGGAIVAWQDKTTGAYDIHVDRFDSFNQPMWGDAVACAAPNAQVEPAVAPDGSGGVLVAWADQRGGAWDVYVQHILASGNRATGWPVDGLPVCVALGSQNEVAIAADGAGGAVVAWTDYRLGDIYVQRVSASGTLMWGANGVLVCGAYGYEVHPVIAGDGAGGAVLTWGDGRSSPGLTYAQRVSAAGVPVWTTDGVPLDSVAAYVSTQRIVYDGKGGAIVMWGGGGSCRVQRVDATGSRRWGRDGLRLNLPEVYSGSDGDLVADGAGGATVVWEGSGSGSVRTVAQRVDSTGATSWTPGGAPVCIDPNHRFRPRIAAGTAGRTIIIWSDWRYIFPYDDVFASSLDASGNMLWPTSGVPVSVEIEDQSDHLIVPDGVGGAYVAWRDRRDVSRDFVMLDHLDASGNLWSNWMAAGVSGDGPAADRSTASVTPNPTTGPIAFEMHLTRPASGRIDVIDVGGRCVRRLSVGRFAVGSVRIGWDARDEKGQRVAPGLYFLSADMGSERLTRRVIVLD